MTVLHEAAQKALEALELAVRQNSHDMMMTGEEIRKGEAAIEALRSALAQQGEPQHGEECTMEAPYIGHDCDPRRPDSDKVICPACCTQFRAIPTDVQQLMLDAGFEPPFTAAPAPQAQQPQSLTVVSSYTSDLDVIRRKEKEAGEAFLKKHGIGVKK